MEKKYTLVTGATGGLGRAFCFELLKQNRNLIITATKKERLESLKAELNEQNKNIDILCMECDMSSEKSRKLLFNEIKDNNLSIDMLINNAGYITEGAVENVIADSLLQAIKVNCEGVVDLTKFVVDNHKSQEKLNILTVSSLAALYPMPYMGIYAATKSFLLSFMTALREEVKDKGIIVSTTLPSGIYTTQAMKDAIASQGIAGKLSSHTPEFIAKYSLKKALKGKAIIVPGAFNRFTKFVSNFASYTYQAKFVGKRWKKSQNKRNIK